MDACKRENELSSKSAATIKQHKIRSTFTLQLKLRGRRNSFECHIFVSVLEFQVRQCYSIWPSGYVCAPNDDKTQTLTWATDEIKRKETEKIKQNETK